MAASEHVDEMGTEELIAVVREGLDRYSPSSAHDALTELARHLLVSQAEDH
jgi:hypothetical protein